MPPRKPEAVLEESATLLELTVPQSERDSIGYLALKRAHDGPIMRALIDAPPGDILITIARR